jgi:tetratricopeptide (TPR) repeat protein
MAAHIYTCVGRYGDAILANQRAIAADKEYLEHCGFKNDYTTGYYPHNKQFLVYDAMMDGQEKLAVQWAKVVAERGDDETIKDRHEMAAVRVMPYWVNMRFGRWDAILKEPSPAKEAGYALGMWHFARGLALLAKGDIPGAENSAKTIRGLLDGDTVDGFLFSENTTWSLLAIAPDVLEGEIAAAKKDFDSAIAHLDTAVRREDGLGYAEPAEWLIPVRQTLGTILLDSDRPRQAETVYWEDLKRHPNNGWSLLGLHQALEANQNQEDAKIVDARFGKAWARSDVNLPESRIPPRKR